MSTVTVPQVNPNDEVTALSVNQGPNAIAAVLNGNVDDANISSVSGTKIAAGTAPATAFTDSANVEKYRSESGAAFVVSGLVWSTLTGLNGAMTSGVYYSTNGSRVSVSAIATKAFTASNDTYVSISATGTVNYSPVANGATPPALPAGDISLAVVVTNGSTITAITDKRSLDNSPSLFFKEIARRTLTSAVDTITVTGIPAKKYIKILVEVIGINGLIDVAFNFNGDVGNNYARRLSIQGGADTTSVSTNKIAASNQALGNHQIEITMQNLSTNNKIGSFYTVSENTAGAATIPDRLEGSFKWASNTQVTSVTITNAGAGDYNIGSEVIVMGHD